MLCFYVFEITARFATYHMMFFCGDWHQVAWNLLDIVVVLAGVMDQWINPVLHLGHGATHILRMFRLLRLLRLLKMIHIFLDADLRWAERPAFQSFIGLVIVFNSLLMGVEVDVPWKGWKFFEQFLLVIYVFELAVRVKNLGKKFLCPDNPDIVWNVLDSLIVSSSVADSWLAPCFEIMKKSLFGVDAAKDTGGISLSNVMMLMRMLRLFRILRLAKLVRAVQPLYKVVTSVVSAFQGVMWVLVLTIVTLYAMAILSTTLIG